MPDSLNLPELEMAIDDIESAKKACASFRDVFDRLKAEIAKVIVGQEDVVEKTLIALFANGHVLLEGVPGLGKTLLVSTLSKTLTLPFSRIQFTGTANPIVVSVSAALASWLAFASGLSTAARMSLIPINCPARLISAPPVLPLLMLASVWKCPIELPCCEPMSFDRGFEDRTPSFTDTVWP